MEDHFLSFKAQMKFKSVDEISEHYRMVDLIGSGAFGKVFSGASSRSGMPCAIKSLSKAYIRSQNLEQLNKNEFEIVEQIAHPNIVRVYDLLEDENNYYIVMELMRGGGLNDRIKMSPGGRLPED